MMALVTEVIASLRSGWFVAAICRLIMSGKEEIEHPLPPAHIILYDSDSGFQILAEGGGRG